MFSSLLLIVFLLLLTVADEPFFVGIPNDNSFPAFSVVTAVACISAFVGITAVAASPAVAGFTAFQIANQKTRRCSTF